MISSLKNTYEGYSTDLSTNFEEIPQLPEEQQVFFFNLNNNHKHFFKVASKYLCPHDTYQYLQGRIV